MPGTQKQIVRMIFSTNEPMRPVVRMARGGQTKHKKYRMIIDVFFVLTPNIGDCYGFFAFFEHKAQLNQLIQPNQLLYLPDYFSQL